MFAAWGRFVYRRRWPVLAVSGVLLLASIFIVIQGGKLQSGGFIETSESGRASRLIERELPRAGAATFTLIFSSDTLNATSPEFRKALDAALAPLRSDPRVAAITTPFDGTALDPTRQMSKDGHAVAVDVAAKDDLATARDYYPELRALVRSDTLRIQATGLLAINNGFNAVLQEDLRRAETVSLPLALLLLLIVFGSLVAALVPRDVGARDHVLRAHRGDRPIRAAVLPGDVPLIDGHLGRDRRRECGPVWLDVPSGAPCDPGAQPRPRAGSDPPAGLVRHRLVARAGDRGHAPATAGARSDRRIHPRPGLAIPSPAPREQRRDGAPDARRVSRRVRSVGERIPRRQPDSHQCRGRIRNGRSARPRARPGSCGVREEDRRAPERRHDD